MLGYVSREADVRWLDAVVGRRLGRLGAGRRPGGPTARASHAVARAEQTLQHVVIDRSLSTVPLFTGAFADDPEGGGYGMLEQWVPRVGNYTSRRGRAIGSPGDALVVICPTLLPSPRFRDELIDWVQSGGRLIVFDTPDVTDSTANSLLMLFGLTSVHNAVEQKNEPLRLADRSRETPLRASCEIQGGEALASGSGTDCRAH